MNEFDQDKDYQLLHKKYQEASTEVAAPAVDATILQAAHQSVAASAKEKNDSGVDTQSVKRSWFVPLSYVAILVVSLSVVMKLAFEPIMMESGINPPVYEAYDDIAEERSLMEQSGANVVSARKKVMPQQMSAQAQRENMQRDIVASQGEKKVAQSPALKKQMLFSTEETKTKVRVKQQVEKPAVAVVASDPVESTVGQSQLAGASKYAETSLEMAQSDAIEQDNERQKARIEKMLELLRSEKFDELKQALIDYRKKYPLNKHESLPDQLRLWEKQNIAQSPHTE